MSIYPLLNHVYEEVGSVEVEVNWGGPEGWMSKAKVDSIIHRTKGDGGKVTSFSIDDVVYEDPIRRVRESMEKNRSWMSEINGSLGKMERPSRFGDGYDANPETPWDMGDNDRSEKGEIGRGAKRQQKR